MAFGAHLNPRHDPGRALVVVELWEIGHTAGDIRFSTSAQRDASAAVVAIPIPDIVKLTRARRAGDYYTRALVTLRRSVAARHRLQAMTPRVFVDPLFRFISRDPVAYRVGLKHDHHWCHLWCAPGDEAELHEFACSRAVGMRRAWFQGHDASFPHYDLVPPRRAAAVRAGAQEVQLRTWLEQRRAPAAATPAESSS